MGETLATCPRKAESSSRSSTRLVGDRQQSHFWQSLRRVSVGKLANSPGRGILLSAYCNPCTGTFACTERMAAPSLLPDCTAHIQLSSTSVHAAVSEILRFSPFNTISRTVFADRPLDRAFDWPLRFCSPTCNLVLSTLRNTHVIKSTRFSTFFVESLGTRLRHGG